MFFVPRWVTFVVATLVALFGAYRLYIAWKSSAEELAARKGLYGKPRRTHVLFGILYLVLAGFLFASGFGYNPFRSAETPAPPRTRDGEIELRPVDGARRSGASE